MSSMPISATRRVRVASRLVVLLGLLTGAGALQPTAAQGQFQVVVNAESPISSLSKQELSRLFLKKTVQWSNGQKVEPVDLPEGSSVRAAFSSTVHDRPTAAIKVFWQRQIFAGTSVPPVEKTSDREVLTFVASNPNAIGYVSTNASVGQGVKVVTVTGT